MSTRVFRWLEHVTGAVVTVALCALVTGPGWLVASEHVTFARLGEPVAAAPGHGALAQLVLLLPIGEAGVRVALLSALAMGLAAAGVVALVRALVPREAPAAIGGVLALLLVPAIRVAATTPGPATLTAAGVAWTAAGLVALRRGEGGERALVLGLALAFAGAPWIGVALALVAVPIARTALKRSWLALIPLAVLVPLVIVAGLPPLVGGGRVRAIVGALGADAGALVLGAGALGLGFAAATRLRGAGVLLLVTLAATVGAVVSPAPAPDAGLAIQVLLAAGLSVLAAAGVRIAGSAEGRRRALLAAACSLVVPLVQLAMPIAAPPDAADAAARAATDLAGPTPPGPGLVLVGNDALASALHHENIVAGLRPDLTYGLRAPDADTVAVNLMRRDLIVMSDVPAFGRLDVRLAQPTGRGFRLLLGPPDAGTPIAPPANYPGTTGADIAARFALARARWEAAQGRLDDAARAAGFVGTRFDAGAVAVLAASVPSRERPALFGFVPPLPPADGHVLLELFGDDLAWVAGINEPPLSPSVPPMRRLHALWRGVLRGIAPPANPVIAALGRDAVVATARMLLELKHFEAAEAAARKGLEAGDHPDLLLALGTALAHRGGYASTEHRDDALLAEAESVLGRAATAAPRDAEPLVWRGLVQVARGNTAGARESWQAAEQRQPGRADVAALLEEHPAP